MACQDKNAWLAGKWREMENGRGWSVCMEKLSPRNSFGLFLFLSPTSVLYVVDLCWMIDGSSLPRTVSTTGQFAQLHATHSILHLCKHTCTMIYIKRQTNWKNEYRKNWQIILALLQMLMGSNVPTLIYRNGGSEKRNPSNWEAKLASASLKSNPLEKIKNFLGKLFDKESWRYWEVDVDRIVLHPQYSDNSEELLLF